MPLVTNQNFRSAYSTVEEITRKDPFDVITGEGIVSEAKSKLNLQPDTTAVGVSLTGSNVLVSTSNGKSVETVRLKSGSQVEDLDVAYQIIKTVSDAATGMVNVFFNIAGMPTEGKNAAAFAKSHTFNIFSLRGLYYLCGFDNGPVKTYMGYETHDAKTAENPVDHYIDIGALTTTITDHNRAVQLSDENGSEMLRPIADDESTKYTHAEVSNDTVTAALTAATIEKANGNEVRNVDAIVLGTGNNKGQVVAFDTKDQKITNEESGHVVVPKAGQFAGSSNQYTSVDEPAIQATGKYLSPLDTYITSEIGFKQPLTIENLFAGGNDDKPNVNDLRGIRLGLHCFREHLKNRTKSDRRLMVTRLIDSLNWNLRGISEIKDNQDEVSKKLGFDFGRGILIDAPLLSNKDLTKAAMKEGSLEQALVVDKYRRMAEIYRDKDGAKHYEDLDLLAVTGSVIVSDFINVPKAREIFCKTLGITEDKLFLHKLGGDDGMGSMVKILASTPADIRFKAAQARLTTAAA